MFLNDSKVNVNKIMNMSIHSWLSKGASGTSGFELRVWLCSVSLFHQFLGSGLTGFNLKVRVLEFSGTPTRHYLGVSFKVGECESIWNKMAIFLPVRPEDHIGGTNLYCKKICIAYFGFMWQNLIFIEIPFPAALTNHCLQNENWVQGKTQFQFSLVSACTQFSPERSI